MAHSVERHLEVTPVAYDAEIRRFVPAYETMLDELVGALKEHLPARDARVIDLGAGTASVSARVAASFPSARLVVLDADAAMLEQARARLAPFMERVELRHRSFADPLPRVHAAVASLALHHVHDRAAKTEVYRNVRAALEPGGVLVNADATVPASEALARPMMKRWAAHLVANGDTEEQAFARFAQWAGEDRYFGVDEEMAMLHAAGFVEIDVRFRHGPCSVMIARRPLA